MDVIEQIDKKVENYRMTNEHTWRQLYDFSSETIGIILSAYRTGLYNGMTLEPRRKSTTRKSTKRSTKVTKKSNKC